MPPETFRSSGFLERGQLELVCGDGPTYVSSTCSAVIDCFVVQVGLVGAISKVELDVESFTPSHVPLSITFFLNVTAMEVLRLFEPKRLPVEEPFGPRNRPQTWERATALYADSLVTRVRGLAPRRQEDCFHEAFGRGASPPTARCPALLELLPSLEDRKEDAHPN